MSRLDKKRSTTSSNNYNVVKKLANIDSEVNNSIDNAMNISLVSLEQLEEAPVEWNFYGVLPSYKMTELIESIEEIGLQNAPVVWEQDNNKYMILSGHNRVRAYIMLRDSGEKEYDKIPVSIRKKDELTPEQAEQIIIDTNWVQRQLTPMQKSMSIIKKYKAVKEENKGKRVNVNEIIAKEYDITKRQITDYKSLMNLIPKIQQLVEDSKISIKAGVRISRYSNDIQNEIAENYPARVINKKYNLLKEDMTLEEIDKVFDMEGEEKLTTIKITLPKDNKAKFIKELKALKEKYGLEI